MNKLFKYFLILLSLLLIVVPIVYAVTLLKTSQGAFESSHNDHDSARKSNLRSSKVNASQDPISILFLGIDENDNRKKNGQSSENSRTDSMILSTFNQDKEQIRMLSIPRDTISYIPKVGYYDKITHAHAYGGPTAAMDAVEATMNVPVDYYARVNMEAFVDAVDELGGIEYDVPYDINEINKNDDGRTKIKKGRHNLNGEEALAVARTRHKDSDLKRGQRQMELLKLLFAKAQKVDSLNKLDKVIKIVGKNSSHNLNYKEIRALASTYLKSDVDIKKSQLTGDDDYLNGVYYYNPSIKSIMESSNTLRKDLGLSPITDKRDFLNQRVIDRYGQLVPQTKLDEDLLGKNQNDTTSDKDDEKTLHSRHGSNDNSSNRSHQSSDQQDQSHNMNPNGTNNSYDNQSTDQQDQYDQNQVPSQDQNVNQY
ncbi:LCP family protein [Staphylococcus sp. SQ8-PEA]|uniref:LCP family protein n=1 Tax=Staphylococcus marylandisciuri TaxID=2981529 RepID=A0ABT2QPX7_9STAP|nr:LCP family protein [Staphylococcus marylandisciuri]MCU5746036.1 LCP family protein [Staphylococcus marylandisciuri]